MYRIATFILGFFLLATSSLAQVSDPALRGGEATFEGLGDLPGGSVISFANGVSADGSVVVGNSVSDEGGQAFRWEDGTMEGLGDLEGGDFHSEAHDVSADGSVVVGYGASDETISYEAYRWEDGVMEPLGDLDRGEFRSEGYGVSADGSIVVGRGSTDNGPGLTAEAFRWEDGTMESLGNLDGGLLRNEAFNTSADGSVVVGYGFGDDAIEAYRWTEDDGMVGLGDLEGGTFHSRAHGVSPDGSIVVGSGTSTEGQEAFRWEDGTMEGLGDLEGGLFLSIAYDVSADGSIVVGSSGADGGLNAFIWTEEEGMRYLKEVLENDHGLALTGWTLSEADAVSDDGAVIVGHGTNPDGNIEAYRAVIPRPPVNDDIADAIEIPTIGDTYEGYNVNATIEEGESEPSCRYQDWTTNYSIWWTFSPEDDGLVTIDTNGSLTTEGLLIDTILTLHNASDLSEVACDDDGGNQFQSLIEEAPITAGETYLIRVAGYNEDGDFSEGTIQLTTDFQFGVADEASPDEIAEGLTRPSPNPANGISRFTVAVESGQNVTVEVFDVTGRRVQTLYEGALADGTSETLALDASVLPAGIYLIRATGEDFNETRRVTIVR